MILNSVIITRDTCFAWYNYNEESWGFS